MTSSSEKYKSLLRVRYELIGAVMGNKDFSTTDQLGAVNKERRYGKKDRDDVNGVKLRGIVIGQG